LLACFVRFQRCDCGRSLELPSNAFSVHLRQLLLDADELDDAHAQLRTGAPGRQYGLASLNRAAVVMAVSAWESYVEELMRESIQALRPLAPPPGAWPALNAYAMGLLGNFNTPNPVNVERLIRNCLGVAGRGGRGGAGRGGVCQPWM
jgi:hypothetical protein